MEPYEFKRNLPPGLVNGLLFFAVVIVGSGPTGAAYARILSEESPDATVALFEVGPTVSDPPGAHVKNIEDPAARADAQVVVALLVVLAADLHGVAVDSGDGLAGTYGLFDGVGDGAAADPPGRVLLGGHWPASCPGWSPRIQPRPVLGSV